MRIGLPELGGMGCPMVGHLIAAGHELYLTRVKEVSQPLVEEGGSAVGSPSAAAEVVILMLPDAPDVETLWRA